MPKYIYKCKNCQHIFEIVHEMTERLTDCLECDKIDVLKKIPSKVSVINKNKEIGKIVQSHIEEVKRDLLEEKEKITTREYIDD